MKIKSSAGFTLIELLVVIAVAGILTVIALPSFKSLMEGQRVKNASYELFSSLNRARSEAIKSDGNILITPEYCQITAPSPSHNEIGWVISTVSGGVIHTEAQLKGVTLTTNPANIPANTSCTPTLNMPWITYLGNGRTTATVTPTFLIDAYGAATPTPYATCIKIELSGMPRIYKPSGGSCG